METASKESKCVKKSTPQQLNAMVEHMELNPEFARGTPVFGSNRQSMDEQWRKLTQKLNSLGPPTRTAVEWKKTWADLKSRTKKKIADKNSMHETGGGVYRFNSLTQLEEVVERTLFLSTVAAPDGTTFGPRECNVSSQSIENCFVSLVDTPPRNSQTIAVVTPTRQINSKQNPQQTIASQCTQKQSNPQHNMQQQSPPQCSQRPKKRNQHDDSEDELPCSSTKQRRTVADEQLSLIRRQMRVSERAAATVLRHLKSKLYKIRKKKNNCNNEIIWNDKSHDSK